MKVSYAMEKLSKLKNLCPYFQSIFITFLRFCVVKTKGTQQHSVKKSTGYERVVCSLVWSFFSITGP